MKHLVSSDLVSGGLFFEGAAIFCWTISTALPLWWSTSTLLGAESCNCGSGLWRSNWTWGDDLNDENLLEPILCHSSNPFVTSHCDAPFPLQTESHTKGYIAGCFSIASIVLAIIGWLLGFSSVTWNGHDIDLTKFRRRLCWAAVSAVAAICCQIMTICIFMNAPLLENAGTNIGCSFIFMSALNSDPLQCFALGPAFGLAIGGCLLSAGAYVFFFLSFKNPGFIGANTGRYSMFQEQLLGERPLDNTTDKRSNAPRTRSVAFEDDPNRLVIESSTEQCDSAEESPYADTSKSVEKSFLSHFARFVRLYTVPIMLILDAGLFVWSNCSVGALIEPFVRITLPGYAHAIAHRILPHQVNEDGIIQFRGDVFEFNLFTSLQHFWRGEAYALAFLIGIFSGVWPYVKILTMLFLWYVPATETLRGRLLHWLDVLGKWSLIDAFVLCLMAVAFNFTVDDNIYGLTAHVDMNIRPGWGVYSFVVATMWCLILSHYMSHIHRQAIERRDLNADVLVAMKNTSYESLASRTYAPFARQRHFSLSGLGKALLMLILLSTLVVTLLGQVFDTFEFQFSGLVGVILPADQLNRTFSLVTNGELLPTVCEKGGYLSGGPFWNWFITVMYFVFAMAVPLLSLVCFIILWTMPMTLSSTISFYRFLSILQSWAALDVFIVSIIAAVLEIGKLSSSILEDNFGSQQDEICDILKKPAVDWLITHVLGLPSMANDCVLFRVSAVLNDGCWMLLAGVIAWGICAHLVMEFAEASIQERLMVLKVLCSKGENPETQQPDPYELMRIFTNTGSHEFDQASDFRLESEFRIVDDGSGNASEGDELLSEEQRMNMVTYDFSADSFSRAQLKYFTLIMQAQEYGAQHFTGYLFCGKMYGPFPQSFWEPLTKVGIFVRVPWNRVGNDLHLALLLVNRNDNLRSNVDTEESPEYE